MKYITCLIICLGISITGKPQQRAPVLTPEKSNFTKTSLYKDVMDVVDYARSNADNMHYEVFGQSEMGKDLPLLVFSDQDISSPKQARRLNRPMVFIFANIHSGEVEGKEALLRIILELTEGQHQGWLKKVTLLIAPIYNADGNDMISRKHRPNQYGPSDGVGTRANAKGLNLNRDFTKLATSEAQGLVKNVLTKWDPMLLMDLHTTNGSSYGYQLTYEPPLNPNIDQRILNFQHDVMSPQLRKDMKNKGWIIHEYGNFPENAPQKGFFTTSPKPRFSHNYFGLKNRLTLLSETYAYVNYKQRIDLVEDFVESTIQFMADNADRVLSLKNELNKDYSTFSDNHEGGISFDYIQNPKSFQLLTADLDTVYKKELDAHMYKRMGIADTITSKLYNRYRSTDTRPVPFAYALDNRSREYDNIIENLKMHGIQFYEGKSTNKVNVKRFRIEKLKQAQSSYEGRRMVMVMGEFKPVSLSLDGWTIIPTNNTNQMLIFELLEPESEDGYVAWGMLGGDVTWNMLSNGLKEKPFPVVKVAKKAFLNK